LIGIFLIPSVRNLRQITIFKPSPNYTRPKKKTAQWEAYLYIEWGPALLVTLLVLKDGTDHRLPSLIRWVLGWIWGFGCAGDN
jgi:hypothetical protein